MADRKTSHQVQKQTGEGKICTRGIVKRQQKKRVADDLGGARGHPPLVADGELRLS